MEGTKHFLWVCLIVSQKLVFFDQLYILATKNIGSCYDSYESSPPDNYWSVPSISPEVHGLSDLAQRPNPSSHGYNGQQLL